MWKKSCLEEEKKEEEEEEEEKEEKEEKPLILTNVRVGWSAGRHAGFVIRASPNLAFTYDLTVVSLPNVCVRLSSVCCHEIFFFFPSCP